MLEVKRVARTADRLRMAMSDANKTQADLMRDTGLQRSAISRYLSGEYEPKALAVGKMSKALGVSEMWLFGYDVPRERTAEQIKNDQLAELIVKLRANSDFYNTVIALSKLNEKQYQGVKQLIAAFDEH